LNIAFSPLPSLGYNWWVGWRDVPGPGEPNDRATTGRTVARRAAVPAGPVLDPLGAGRGGGGRVACGGAVAGSVLLRRLQFRAPGAQFPVYPVGGADQCGLAVRAASLAQPP